ncbi:hypothetical protein HZS_6782 [Henneguya salminicola]|nr:hypothetical protein HZS_6782 [Henneguya salminicola]
MASETVKNDANNVENKVENLWTEHTTENGLKYYFNSQTNASAWQKPEELKTEEEKIRESVPWKEHTTNGGKTYYYNHVTKETTWDCPHELAEALTKISDLKGINLNEKMNENYSTMEEAKQAFKDLLRDCNVPSIATWDIVTKMTNHDPRFNALKQVNEKKKVFNTYKQIRANEEKQLEKIRTKENRERLKIFMENNSLINSYTRYSKAHRMLRTHEIWSAVPDRERRDLLDDIQPILAKRERDLEKEASKNNQKLIIKFFKKHHSYFSVTTKWIEVNLIAIFLQVLEVIKNEKLINKYHVIKNILESEKEDALIGYENYIAKLEEGQEKEQLKTKHEERRINRINRENFTDWLIEMYEQGKIDKNSKWTDFWPILKKDKRTMVLMRQSGSSPLDLFKFFLDALKGKHHDKKIIKKLIKENKAKITNETSYDNFVAQTANSSSILSRMEKISARLSFIQVRDKIFARSEYKKLKNDKQHKHLCRDFYNMLKLLEPPLSSTTKWEEIWPHLTNEPEYKSLNIESERHRVFKKFLRKMSKKNDTHVNVEDSKHKKKDGKSRDSSSSELSKSRKRHHKEAQNSPKLRETPPPLKKKSIRGI